jgi:hypothetical protein
MIASGGVDALFNDIAAGAAAGAAGAGGQDAAGAGARARPAAAGPHSDLAGVWD